MSVKIIVDSACDISKNDALRLGVEVLPLKTMFGNETFLDGVTMTHEQFYDKLTQSKDFPTTSQLSPYTYAASFNAALEKGYEVLCITLSAALSGCYQSALIAAADCEGEVYVVDSTNVTIGERLIVMLAAQLRDKGLSAREIAAALDEKKKDLRLVALLDTLEYLKRGGRIPPAVAMIGGMLSIKPIVYVDEGLPVFLGKARGLKNGGIFMRNYINQEGIDFELPYYLAYTGKDDTNIKKYIAENGDLFLEGGSKVRVSTVGSTIGTHIGPGAIAVSYFAKNTKE